MKKYEIMYILKPELDADQIKAANANLQKILESNGAKIEDVNEWGLRDLEFNRLTRIDVNVLRYLITVSE